MHYTGMIVCMLLDQPEPEIGCPSFMINTKDRIKYITEMYSISLL